MLDTDAPRRFRVVEAGERQPQPQRSPNAEAAARYRARQRGQTVPKRKPGPKPTRITELRDELREEHRRRLDAELQLRITRDLLARQTKMLTVERVTKELLDVLQRGDPRDDTAERQVLLRDLAAVLDERHEYWDE
jgi:hypothetical protein